MVDVLSITITSRVKSKFEQILIFFIYAEAGGLVVGGVAVVRLVVLGLRPLEERIGHFGVVAAQEESSAFLDCAGVVPELDVGSELPDEGEDNVVHLEGIGLSPLHGVEDAPVDFFAAHCHLLDEFPPVLLKIRGFEYTIVDVVDCLCWVADVVAVETPSDGGCLPLLFLGKAFRFDGGVLLLGLRVGESLAEEGMVEFIVLIEDLDAELVPGAELLHAETDDI